jgi:hypothetical protein
VSNLAAVSFASGADFDTFVADALTISFGNVSTNIRLRTLGAQGYARCRDTEHAIIGGAHARLACAKRADRPQTPSSGDRTETMMSSKTGISILALSFVLSACSTNWLPWARSDEEQPKRLPEGAVEFQCAQAKTLLVRHAADGKSVWIFFPDREFRLDRIASSANERYSNGATTMTVESEGIALDADGTRLYAACNRKTK